MAKKPTDAATGDNEQTSAATVADVSTPAAGIATSAADAAATAINKSAVAPLPEIPEPIVAPGGEDGDRPMSGGSFIRLEDGTLIRNTEA
jgi:hypothetical protein